MPANLPPQYFEAEKRYREAKTPEDKISALEEMLMIMPKHKGTDKLRADLRRKISKFRAQAQSKKSVSRRESAYKITKEGAAQVAIIGPPNSGKSSLLSVLTNANPEVAEFPHTTWKPTPGMVQFENIQFQLIDTPPISNEYIDPWIADLIRRADIIVILLDIKSDIIGQWEDTMAILNNLRVFPEGSEVPGDLKKPPFMKKIMVVVNKVDDAKEQEDYDVFIELSGLTLPSLPISVEKKRNLENFIRQIYETSGLIRVYTKAPGKAPDMNAPFVIPRDSTLEELANKIHKDFVEKLKYARIWGNSVFDGQMVQKDYILQEGDIVELHI